jgi:hypothetical protein
VGFFPVNPTIGNISPPLPIASGGTGAITAAAAATALAVLPLTGGSLSGAVTFNALASTFGGTNTGTPATLVPAFSNGTAAQLTDTSRDYMVYLTIGTAGTAFILAIGPTSGVADTIVPSSPATSGDQYSFRLPAGWFVKWSATTATLAGQFAVGC